MTKIDEIKKIAWNSFIGTTVGPWSSSVQRGGRAEVILAGLGIGHARCARGCLVSMPHDGVPRCGVCGVRLAVGRVLCECRDFDQRGRICLRGESLLDILSDSFQFSLGGVLVFLGQAGLIGKIWGCDGDFGESRHSLSSLISSMMVCWGSSIFHSFHGTWFWNLFPGGKGGEFFFFFPALREFSRTQRAG